MPPVYSGAAMKLGIEFEYTGRRDPVPSFAITVTIPWRRSTGNHSGHTWGWRAKTWRLYRRAA